MQQQHNRSYGIAFSHTKERTQRLLFFFVLQPTTTLRKVGGKLKSSLPFGAKCWKRCALKKSQTATVASNEHLHDLRKSFIQTNPNSEISAVVLISARQAARSIVTAKII